MKMNKPYVELDLAVIEQARQIDFLTYSSTTNRPSLCVYPLMFTAPKSMTT